VPRFTASAPTHGPHIASRSNSRTAEFTPAQAGCLTALLLLGVYAATIAPTVTLWDAGEFLAAAHGLGIPHPPGTPLYILLANVWAGLLPFLPFALAVNLASAVATASGCGVLAALVCRATGRGRPAVAGGLTAGGMFAVWQNATETEVYAVALLLSVIVLWAAAERDALGDQRATRLVAFLFGLSVPLHLSALATGPGALWLLAADDDGRFSLRKALVPTGCYLVAVGIGTMSVAPVILAFTCFVPAVARPGPLVRRSDAALSACAALVLVVLGASAVVAMIIRAAHDPSVNQGNATTLGALVDVVGRRQYDVPGLWPRRAPLWLQVGNFAQYADWQVAFGLDRWPGGSWRRTPWTIVFVALGWVGARWHAAADRRTFVGLGIALLCAWIGVLPSGALHEARERDYFFATAFALWGLWSGAGAVVLARRAKHWLPRAASAAACLLPFVLNYPASERSGPPQSVLADVLGESLLASAEPNAVLVLAGDNDTYAVWYQQEVRALRRDVVPITLPLLGADWYRQEQARRHRLLSSDSGLGWRGEARALRQIAADGARSSRPINFAVSVPSATRRELDKRWRLRGMVFAPDAVAETAGIRVDTQLTRQMRDAIAQRIGEPRRPLEGTAAYVFDLLHCPAAALAEADPVGALRGDILGNRTGRVCNLRE
jgi:hypothetical protein